MAETTFDPSSVLFTCKEAVRHLLSKLDPTLHPPNLKIGIICGSGLNRLGETIDKSRPHAVFPYGTIPGFKSSTVEGHSGQLVFGFMKGDDSGTAVVMMVGRAHFYEGHSIHTTTFPIRVLSLLRLPILIVTNAAGGLNRTYSVGDIVLLNDHLNLPGLCGTHPLRGPNIADFGTRFPAMSNAYDLTLRRLLHHSWRSLRREGKVSTSRKVHEGVYAFVSGPSFETRAECRFLGLLGADVVGMSTVPEIVVARHCGMRVLAMSLVTNCAVLEPMPRGDAPMLDLMVDGVDGASDTHGPEVTKMGLTMEGGNEILEKGKATHQEVLESGEEAAGDMERLVTRFVEVLGGKDGMPAQW